MVFGIINKTQNVYWCHYSKNKAKYKKCFNKEKIFKNSINFVPGCF